MACEARAAKVDILIGVTPKARKRTGRWNGVKTAGRVWKHSTLADVAEHIALREIVNFQTVTLVRNPWDRVISYYHWLRVQSFAHPAVGLAKTHDFSGFLNHPQTVTAFRMWPYGAYPQRGDRSEKPGIFIRLEHFAKDVAPVEAYLGFRLTLARANECARGRDWRKYYTEKDAELVGELCGENAAWFGYQFDGSA